MKINVHVNRGDFHSHTTNSDGALSVKELIDFARSKGLDYFAITDHDCLNGADEAWNMELNDLHMVYGIELSTHSLGESVHLLGYFKEQLPMDSILRQRLTNQTIQRKARAHKMLDLLEEHFNIKLDRSFIDKVYSVTRGNIGYEIINQGYNYSKAEIYGKMIGEDSPCYIPSSDLTPVEGIKWLKEAGAKIVLAHPCLLEKNNVEDIIKLGIDGIEAIYPRTNNEETKYRNLAKKYNLFISAGSDFHRLNDGKHADVGSCIIKGKDLEKFLEAIYK